MNNQNKYKLKEMLVYVNPHRLAFPAGIVLEGPRKGVHILDEFCMEQCLYKYLIEKLRSGKRYRISYNVKDCVFKLLSKDNLSYTSVELDGFNNFVIPKKYRGCKVHRRLKGLEFCNNIEIDFDKFIL